MPPRKASAAIAVCLFNCLAATAPAIDIPAVNLPPGTPDVARDAVARSLARGRDTLGRALHPFRGEFHGLGVNAGGYSWVTDVSGDGRVIVGQDYGSDAENRPFVWSPATGKAFYNMLPTGVTGKAIPTSISADGVYVAGNLSTNDGDRAFRWSLAGSENCVSGESKAVYPAALSRNGSVLAGTYRTPYVPPDYGPDPYYSSNLQDGGRITIPPLAKKRSWAFHYSSAGAIQEPGVLPSGTSGFYVNSIAADVTGDGKTVLVTGFNSSEDNGSESFLWTTDGGLLALGNYREGDNDARNTVGNAISADGSTVVGTDGYDVGSGYYEYNRAVLWREETSWIDLGELKTTAGRRVLGAWANDVSGDGSVVLGEAVVSWMQIEGGMNFGQRIGFSPFLWDDTRGMRELADVLRLDYGLDLSGWTLNEATGISDDGTTIIGNGLNPTGQSEAWRAVLQRNTPLGDIDFDGDVDASDYQRLAGNLGVTADDGAVFYADGDLNADGRVDQLDADTLLGVYQGRLRGDFNADGVVDLGDYTVWRDRLGQFTGGQSTGGVADSNGDGRVNAADLTAWRANFGRVIGALVPQSIPEPTAATLLAAAALALVSRRR